MKLPNKTHPDSPVGSERDNRIVKISEIPKRNVNQVKSHLEIGEEFDLFDFQSASKLTGSKFVFFKNEAALLELALVNWAFNYVSKRGFTPMTTPDLANSLVVEACGF